MNRVHRLRVRLSGRGWRDTNARTMDPVGYDALVQFQQFLFSIDPIAYVFANRIATTARQFVQSGIAPINKCSHAPPDNGGSRDRAYGFPRGRQARRPRPDEQHVELGRNFGNKLWNACRFRQLQGGEVQGEIAPELLTSYDKWILLKLDQAIREKKVRTSSVS